MKNFPPASSPVAQTLAATERKSQRFILLGGFLGAGKTTVVERLAGWLRKRNLVPGVISNDQAGGLIDTAIGRQHNSGGVVEVTGGCFCCKAGELGLALSRLTAEHLPDVFIAEPVGSCTDLMATVVLPIQQIYAGPLEMAPMSVMVDAGRMYAAWFPVKSGGKAQRSAGFSADVEYILAKQLEEAELVVLNKVDLLTAGQRSKLKSRISVGMKKPIVEVSATTGEGLEEWFTLLMREKSAPTKLMEVDYERYGAGEARMGWFNATLGLHSTAKAVDGNAVLLKLAAAIQQNLEAEGVELAHFKMSLSHAGGELAVVNAVRNGEPASLSRRSKEKVLVGEILINLRAEAEPDHLNWLVAAQVDKPHATWRAVWKNREFFKPGQPQPTHRVTRLPA